MSATDIVTIGMGPGTLTGIITKGLTGSIAESGLTFSGNGVEITNGAVVSATTGTQWPDLFLNDGLSYRQFDVTNTAADSRIIQSVTFDPVSKFSTVVNPGTIAAGATERLLIALTPDAAGTYSSIVTLTITGYVSHSFSLAGTVSSLDPTRNADGRRPLGFV